MPTTSDYLLWYARDMSRLKFQKLYERQIPGAPGALEYKRVELPDGRLDAGGLAEWVHPGFHEAEEVPDEAA